MNMRIVNKPFADWVVGDVEELRPEVIDITDAMFVITRMPDFRGRDVADRVGISTFNELNAASGALIDRRGDEDVDVVRHYGKAVETKLSGISIAEERCDEEFSEFSLLKEALLLKGGDGDCVGAQLLTHRRHDEGKHTPGAKARILLRQLMKAKAKALAYLEAGEHAAEPLVLVRAPRCVLLCGVPFKKRSFALRLRSGLWMTTETKWRGRRGGHGRRFRC